MTDSRRTMGDAIREQEALDTDATREAWGRASPFRWPIQREALPRPEHVSAERYLQQMGRAPKRGEILIMTAGGWKRVEKCHTREGGQWVERTPEELADMMRPVFKRSPPVTLDFETFSEYPMNLGRFDCAGNYRFAAVPAEPSIWDRLKATMRGERGPWAVAGLSLAFFAFVIGSGLVLSALLIMLNP